MQSHENSGSHVTRAYGEVRPESLYDDWREATGNRRDCVK